MENLDTKIDKNTNRVEKLAKIFGFNTNTTIANFVILLVALIVTAYAYYNGNEKLDKIMSVIDAAPQPQVTVTTETK